MTPPPSGIIALLCGITACVGITVDGRAAGLTTWDGRHPIDEIVATVVYFVPADRVPLADWRERAAYFCRRIERFHAREFGELSKLRTRLHPEPFRSAHTTARLREGNADAIFFRSTTEVADAVEFGRGGTAAPAVGFPVLVVLSDVNWRPLDDFSRLSPTPEGWAFDGARGDDGGHFPGAGAGGSRAVYLPDAGQGRGLVSGDGWRVPYRGSDCVVYHEGIGHAIGLPHPEPADGSVMSLGQYRGWLSESWLDDAQKRRLGWNPPSRAFRRDDDLFSRFRAVVEPAVPRPGQPVRLRLEWPASVEIASCRVEYQTSLRGPWIGTAGPVAAAANGGMATLGPFDRPCGVAYRAIVSAGDGERAEVWGYFQVRTAPDRDLPPPSDADIADAVPHAADAAAEEVDLLAVIDPDRDRVAGAWHREPGDGRDSGPLLAPKEYGARIEIPYVPAEEYRLSVIAEPLDEPHGLILGQRTPTGRFLVLVDFRTDSGIVGALENVDGRDVQGNPTRTEGAMLRRGRPAMIVCTVRRAGVEVTVDGRPWIDWRGDTGRLSLSDYWRTPRHEALFLGAYDCRYRFSRITITPLRGSGRALVDTAP